MKTSFILQSRYETMVAKLSDKQAGVLFKAILHYVAAKEKPEGLNDSATAMAFDFICQDIDYNAAKYAEVCALRAQAGRKGGLAKKSKTSNCLSSVKGSTCSKSKHNDVVVDVENEVENDNNILTAQADAAQSPRAALPEKKERQKTLLQQFSNQVLEHFESAVQTPAQKGIWFKRNCRCLRDILNFCNRDIPLALQTIDVCLRGIEKAGLWCGYEAVCRNLPEYMVRAQQELEDKTYAQQKA